MAPNATSQETLAAETAEECFSGGPLPLGDESIRVEDKIYSAKALADLHPGGPLFVKSFAGRDASHAFLSYHRRQFPHSRVKEALEKVDPNVKVDPHAQDDFLELCERVDKVITSSNVAGEFLCFLNGGLNYQIEHHLLPRIHHGHYPKIAPVVKEFCQEKGIPYQHFPTVTSNAWACAKHLFEMGSQKVPKSAKHLVTS
eukprot:TCALIF_12487-PA protein Name:"Similar to des6 Linoleoyl-CoA desaturase (Synechocystis sp. (strain PCC 6803 / Kazusa))" AED:0.17 eAED:0.23 QI:211/0.5/0.66/1/0.5/0.66/3/0/199